MDGRKEGWAEGTIFICPGDLARRGDIGGSVAARHSAEARRGRFWWLGLSLT